MSEERTQYTTQPDELTRLRAENIRLRSELDKQANAWGGYVDAHADNYSRMNACIAELEKTIARLEQEVIGYRLSAAVMEGAYITSDDVATKLKADIARLEQDNKRLRHLDAMPVDAMRVVCMNSMYDAQVGGMSGYDAADFINARDELVEWLDGDA